MAVPTFTSDAELLMIEDKDHCVELNGYIISVIVPQEVGTNKKYKLFKVVLSNQHLKVMLLLWGETLISRYLPDMTVNRIVHIEGGLSKKANASYRRDDDLIPFEIIIKDETVVKFGGFFGGPTVQPQAVIQPTIVTFETIGKVLPVVIEAYLKTRILNVRHRNGAMSWGSASITDGVFKVNLQITNYNEPTIMKGTRVRVNGIIRNENNSEGTIMINCANMNDLQEIVGVPAMPDDQLARGVRHSRRPADNQLLNNNNRQRRVENEETANNNVNSDQKLCNETNFNNIIVRQHINHNDSGLRNIQFPNHQLDHLNLNDDN